MALTVPNSFGSFSGPAELADDRSVQPHLVDLPRRPHRYRSADIEFEL